jgi:hypothetical protein
MASADEQFNDTFESCPPEACEHCKGYAAIKKADGTQMSSWEWCQKFNICAATIDWDKIQETEGTPR